MKTSVLIILALDLLCGCKFMTTKPQAVPIPSAYYEETTGHYFDSSFQYFYDLDLIKMRGISKVDTNQWRSQRINYNRNMDTSYTSSFWGVRNLGDTIILVCNIRAWYKEKNSWLIETSDKKQYKRYKNIWLSHDGEYPGLIMDFNKNFMSTVMYDGMNWDKNYVELVGNTYNVYRRIDINENFGRIYSELVGRNILRKRQESITPQEIPQYTIDFSHPSDTILYITDKNKNKTSKKFTWRNNHKLMHYFNGIRSIGDLSEFISLYPNQVR